MALSRAQRPPLMCACDRDGFLYLLVPATKAWKKMFAVLKAQMLHLYASPKETVSELVVPLVDCDVRPVDAARLKKKNGFEVKQDKGAQAVHTFYVDTAEEQQQWMSALLVATVPAKWPLQVCYTGTEEDRGLVRYLPRLKEVAPYQRRAVLLRKLLLCAVTFDFVGMTFVDEKEMKRQTLMELVDYCDTVKGAFNDASVFVDVITMVTLNIFRALPFRPELAGDDDDEDEPFMEPAWPHLSVVYEFFLHLVQSQQIDLPHKKKAIDAKVVRRLLPLFNSEDLRERDYLKTITHRIYGKLTHRRAAIRRAISNVFFEFVYEGGKCNGIAELLEILASIINGFAVPIKPEHKTMLERALLPLHKPRQMFMYHPQLTYCMTLYASKDPELLIPIVRGILKYWPYGSSSKELLMLNELEELFELMLPSVLKELIRPLFSRIAKCIECPHFQVCERAMWLWNNQEVVKLVVDNAEIREMVLPVIFEGLYRNSTKHWHEAVKQLSQHVLALYMETDAPLYERCMAASSAARA